MTTAGRHVLVAGYSTRAIAESAARAGFAVTAIDAFADLDQHASVRAVQVSHGFSPERVVREARDMACDAVAYLSNFENHPDAVRALGCGRALWGNPPDVLANVRNPHALADALLRRDLPAPALWGDGDGPWLLKPTASGGGAQIRAWTRGTPVPSGFYVQERIDGESGSVTFVASRDGVRVIGISHQLVGLDAFGASGYRYCGSILDDEPPAWLRRAAGALAKAVTEAFALTGVNGIDFIARGGVLYPVEVNPRWCASMELVERARAHSVFAMHADACASAALPDFDATTAPPTGRTMGKAVVFARHALVAGDTSLWSQDGLRRDVPRPGTRIVPGEPVCTVFADGVSRDTCRDALEAEATRVFTTLATWTSHPA